MEKVKVLYFVDRMLRGGIQSLVIDWVSRFDKEKIQVDFLLLDDGNKYELEDTLKELGCNVYKLEGIWLRNPLDFIKYKNALNKFFNEHNDYKVLHLHSTSKNYMVMKYAKKYGIPVRIAHSHNIGFQTKNKVKRFVGNLMKKSLIKYSTDYFACSKMAGEWLFGEKKVNSDKFKIIHNAVDYDKFRYNKKTRDKIREELNIKESEIVIGHVGRFEKQKNHEFLIDIFNEYHKLNNNSKLLLVGTGSLEDSIKEKVSDLGLTDYVIFAGFKDNVNDYMQVMDTFVFPSIYEGLGLVLIEAQASGLTCFTSKDVVPTEAKVSDNLIYISLEKTAKEWAEGINGANIKRKDIKNELKTSGYLIEDVIMELIQIYFRAKE